MEPSTLKPVLAERRSSWESSKGAGARARSGHSPRPHRLGECVRGNAGRPARGLSVGGGMLKVWELGRGRTAVASTNSVGTEPRLRQETLGKRIGHLEHERRSRSRSRGTSTPAAFPPGCVAGRNGGSPPLHLRSAIGGGAEGPTTGNASASPTARSSDAPRRRVRERKRFES